MKITSVIYTGKHLPSEIFYKRRNRSSNRLFLAPHTTLSFIKPPTNTSNHHSGFTAVIYAMVEDDSVVLLHISSLPPDNLEITKKNSFV
jgi:hypothetical protein